jgi:hypothetical protein
MSKVTPTANSAPQIDANLQAMAEIWEKEEKWWLEEGMNPRFKWCFENRVAILLLHSAAEETKIFQV